MVRTRPHTEAAASEAAARAILQGRLRAASEPALLTGARPGTADMGEADMALLADLAAGLPLVLSARSGKAAGICGVPATTATASTASLHLGSPWRVPPVHTEIAPEPPSQRLGTPAAEPASPAPPESPASPLSQPPPPSTPSRPPRLLRAHYSPSAHQSPNPNPSPAPRPNPDPNPRQVRAGGGASRGRGAGHGGAAWSRARDAPARGQPQTGALTLTLARTRTREGGRRQARLERREEPR